MRLNLLERVLDDHSNEYPNRTEIVTANHPIWSFRSVGINQMLDNDSRRGFLSNKLAGRVKERVMSSVAMTGIHQGETPPLRASSFHSNLEISEYDDGLSAFAAVRPRLFGIAYHILGSAAEAEDIVQEVWLRWQSTNKSAVENPAAFLATITTRLCINLAQSAHTRRETYIETWLPEPMDTSSDPRLRAEHGEALKLAVLVLLEKLSPTERAAYILREAFDYSYRQVAGILQIQEASARQLVSRARKHIADGRRNPISARQQRRLLEAFIAAARDGDMAGLEGLFAEEVLSSSNAGGVEHANDSQFFWSQPQSPHCACDGRCVPQGINQMM